MSILKNILAFCLFLTLPALALVDTSAYRISFDVPLDTSFIVLDTFDVTIHVYDQINAPYSGATPVLTVRVPGNGGGTILLNGVTMTDNEDGSYTYKDVNLSAHDSSIIEFRVRVNVEGTNLEDRIFVFHHSGPNPAGANAAWKLEFENPSPVISSDTTKRVFAVLYNAAGEPWAGQTVSIAISTSTGTAVGSSGTMADSGDGRYAYVLNGALLTAGSDYVIRIQQGLQTSIRRSLFVEAYSSFALPELIIGDPTTNRRPAFRWHPVFGAESYTIQIDTLHGFGSPFISVPLNDTSYAPLINLPIDTLYWRVSSNLAPTRYASAIQVILDGSVPVLIAYEPDPTQDRRPTLTWHAVAGAASYTIEIDTLGNFAAPFITSPTNDTAYTPLVNLPTRTIYWRVASDLSATYSSADNFTILPDSIPLLVRFNGDTVDTLRPTFVWHPVSSASYYTIQISRVANFATTVISTPTSDTSYTPLVNLDSNTLFYWRVSSSRNNTLYASRDSVYVTTGGPNLALENNLSSAKALTLTVLPNPSTDAVTLTLTGTSASKQALFLSIYDVSGRLLVRLLPEAFHAGYRAHWDGKGTDGLPVQSGVYLVRLRIGEKVVNQRVMLIK
ncbi:MAG: hypothetical protein A2350_00065 [Candidatus Raymondbacteria bacterium RifOxyB12_full_50_8]|nr:MAG: hypothetical protein A2350_00065 [Candidatus Raymondbacteria bacterium RifOxyB12_full_50_8]OGJ89527.1 MAG: hypothetical protein A2248_03370 [Candidatus Raymondbacteria bacterium RIFOXYA2_FULL_49_16]OGP42495.1 MAG: hypothetical protein A2324_17405 [Candidatus Raymondbacteria bacterium RIFOXYB2_FULL_49_35]